MLNVNYKRFATIEAMKAYALAELVAKPLVFLEPGCHQDHTGAVSHRPQIVVVYPDNSATVLRFNSYTEEDVDFMSKSQRAAARSVAAIYISQVLEARHELALEDEARKATPEGWQEVEAGPEGTSLEVPAKPTARAPMRYKVTLAWNDKVCLEGTTTANLAWETVRSFIKSNFVGKDVGTGYPGLSAYHNMADGMVAHGGYEDETGKASWWLEEGEAA